MSSKFMKIKHIVIPMMTFILLSSQLIGCATFRPTEMVDAINQGESIVLEVAEPSYTAVIKGEQEQEVTWIQLDQLKTFNNGFRQSFDKAFNITIVSENNMSGKSGSLFVNSLSERDGNTTLQSAFRNKVFVTKYWSNTKVSNELIRIASSAYSDISNDNEALVASFNAYYNLLNDAKNPDSFNAKQSISREQFYTLMYKATTPVIEISASEEFTSAVGGETEYTKYAEQLADSGFLQADNKSLDSTNISGNITRAEAVYMLVNTLFPDELAKVTDKDKAYTDTKNSGDLALKCGFKDKVKIDGQNEKKIIEKDKWQAYILAYSLQNPGHGLQDELHDTLVVASKLGLLDGTESRWDETLSKEEALKLLMQSFLAQNTLYGYLSEAEHGTINPNNFSLSDDADGEYNPAHIEDNKLVIDTNPEWVYDKATGAIVEVPSGPEGITEEAIQDAIEKSGEGLVFKPTPEMEAARKEIEAEYNASQGTGNTSSSGASSETKEEQVTSSSPAASSGGGQKDLSSANFKKPTGPKGTYGHGDINAAAGTPDGNVFAD